MRYTAAFLVLAVAMPGAAADQDRRGHDHSSDFCFSVEIQNVTLGSFRTIEGLEENTEVIEPGSGETATFRLRPGKKTFGDITLTKGGGSTDDLERWWEDLRSGKYDRKTLSVKTDLTCDFKAPYTYFPVNWAVSGVVSESGGGNVATEQLTLSVERMEM